MAELAALQKYQPCLLDRLCDEEPDKTVESSSQRVVPLSRYKNGVLRDIQWLLNASTHVADPDDEFDLSNFPLASRSVVNFGMRNMSGLAAAGLDASEVERHLIDAIERFEPRINRRSLRIKSITDPAHAGVNSIAFEISGELWADPMPQHLMFKTKIDLETGQCLGDRPDGP